MRIKGRIIKNDRRKRTLRDTKTVIKNLKYMKMIPYQGNEGELLDESISYTFDSLLADSVSFQSGDSKEDKRYGETSKDPVIHNIVKGQFIFNATSLDIQDEIMQRTLGWTRMDGNNSDILYEPTDNNPIYVLIILAFKSTNKCMLIPRVKINSKLVLASLKSNSGQVDISGVALPAPLNVGGEKVTTSVAYLPDDKIGGVLDAVWDAILCEDGSVMITEDDKYYIQLESSIY